MGMHGNGVLHEDVVSVKRNVACLLVRCLLDMREEPREDTWVVLCELERWDCVGEVVACEWCLYLVLGRGFM
jgi:hypothetical protein